MVSDHELDNFLQGIVGELKRPVRLDSQFDARVMAAIDEPHVLAMSVDRAQRPRRPWLLRPRTIAVSPLVGFLAAASLVGIVVMSSSGAPGQKTAITASAPDELPIVPVANIRRAPSREMQNVQFVLHAPQASSVAIVGDFNDWDETQSKMSLASTDGVWSLTLPLTPGRHEYQFVIDGKQRIADPAAPQATSDFDSPNSIVTVSARVP